MLERRLGAQVPNKNENSLRRCVLFLEKKHIHIILVNLPKLGLTNAVRTDRASKMPHLPAVYSEFYSLQI